MQVCRGHDLVWEALPIVSNCGLPSCNIAVTVSHRNCVWHSRCILWWSSYFGIHGEVIRWLNKSVTCGDWAILNWMLIKRLISVLGVLYFNLNLKPKKKKKINIPCSSTPLSSFSSSLTSPGRNRRMIFGFLGIFKR